MCFNKLEIKEIKFRFALNPFFWFSLIWIFIPLIHFLDFTSIYPSLDIKTAFFLFFIIIFSLFLMKYFDRNFLKNRKCVLLLKDTYLTKLLCIGYFVTILEFIYSGQIPLFNIRSNMGAYKEFGIPMISYATTSYFCALNAIASLNLFYGSKEYKQRNFISLLFIMLRFLLVYSRGSIFFCIIMTFITFISSKKLSFKLLLIYIMIAIIGLFVFNILGNIRMNAKWNDSSEIIKIGHIREKYFFLKDFSWGIVYLDTPLGNLLYNIQNIPVERSTSGLISQLIPDFISKRIFPSYDSLLYLPVPTLTVSSMFAGGYKYGGYLGMALSYIELCIFVILFANLTKKSNKYFFATCIGLNLVTIMTFFDNTIAQSGSSFFILFLWIFQYFDKKQLSFNFVNKIKTINLLENMIKI